MKRIDNSYLTKEIRTKVKHVILNDPPKVIKPKTILKRPKENMDIESQNTQETTSDSQLFS
jgi:hypothetical protein